MDVAKPVVTRAAVMAQRSLRAVTISRLPHILKASAKVSSISTVLICMCCNYTPLSQKSPLENGVQIKIVGDLSQALQVSGVSVQVSALTFVLLTPET
jgi:hypothetical protein